MKVIYMRETINLMHSLGMKEVLEIRGVIKETESGIQYLLTIIED